MLLEKGFIVKILLGLKGDINCCKNYVYIFFYYCFIEVVRFR